MIVVDSSVLVEVLKDKTGIILKKYKALIGADIEVFTRLTEMEILRGARDDIEFKKLKGFFSTQFFLEANDGTWTKAARIYFDLRKKGKIVKAPIDCLIAQIAIEHDAILLHRDKDFQMIAEIKELENLFFQ